MFNKKLTKQEIIDGTAAKLLNEMEQMSSDNVEKIKEAICQNIQSSVRDEKKVKTKRIRKLIVVLAATMIVLVGTAVISSAWRSNFIFSWFGQDSKILLLFDGKSSNYIDIYEVYTNIYLAKDTLSFTPYVFSYIPEGMKFKGCKSVGAIALDIFFEDSFSSKKIVFKQLYLEDGIKGTSFDETNTEKKEVKINGKKTTLFITERSENIRYILKWTDDDRLQYILNGENISKDELLKMAKSIAEMK